MNSTNRFCRLALIATLFGAIPAALAQQSTDTPLPSDLEEDVGVHLVLIDTVVVDRAGRTVSDLTLEDFEIIVDGKNVDIDTLDTSCAAPMDDPRAVRRASGRPHLPTSGDVRRIVVLLDYFHLDQMARVEVLENVREMVRHGMTANDELMVAALAGGLRVEQAFTSDRQRIEDVLKRMEYDISLWNGNFTHLSERSVFESMEALFGVLGAVPGHKGIVMYSNSPVEADQDDLMFADLAASASASRCSIYPVHAVGLVAAAPG